MTPADQHAWVRHRWQELLDIARAATEGPWEIRERDQWVTSVDQVNGAHLITELSHCMDHPGRMDADARHIAAFDPTLTIAVCEAALERLDRHAPSQFFGIICPVCVMPTENVFRTPARWPCPEFLADASPFRTRPDYPEELNR